MIRVLDLDKTLEFFALLGLKEVRRHEVPEGRFSLIFIAVEESETEIELTYNWDQKEAYDGGRNFGHLAFSVKNIYDMCLKLQNAGVAILRPPRDGRMAFVRSPDQISIELLQEGEPLPPQSPWDTMKNQGEW